MAARAAGGDRLGGCPRGLGSVLPTRNRALYIARLLCPPPPPGSWPQQQQTVTGSQFLQVWLPGRPRWHLAPGTLSCDFNSRPDLRCASTTRQPAVRDPETFIFDLQCKQD